MREIALAAVVLCVGFAFEAAVEQCGRFRREISDDGHGRRLRARRERPCRSASEPGEDIPPPHLFGIPC